MEFEKPLITQYTYNNNETMTVGGYPLSEFLNKEMNKQRMLGGSLDFGSARFENLVIPAGLVSFSNDYFTQGGSHYSKKNMKIKQGEVVDDDLFNKVFDLITKCQGRKRGDTKKQYKKILKQFDKTRRNNHK